jgi:hypothetical protein
MSSIFENAVVSLKMGIEDYDDAEANPARALSAVRNFYAGVLLLCKEVLIKAAPKADINEIIGAKYAPVPDGKGGIKYEMEGNQTVDFNTLDKRFKAFKIPIKIRELEKLNILRNDIEHRCTDQPAQAVREAIARVFHIIVELFSRLLKNGRFTVQTLQQSCFCC